MEKIAKKKIILIVSIIAVLLMILVIVLLYSHSPKEVDITGAIHGMIVEENVPFQYEKKKKMYLSPGDRVYVLQQNYAKQECLVKYQDKVGTIATSSFSYFQPNLQEKFSLMVDVSQFNREDLFQESGDFAYFLLQHPIQYVYIRLGGRGWGQKGNWYYDSEAQYYIEACEYLGVPYGFYFLDEALNEEEIQEEVTWVKDFLQANQTSMNQLPLAIDLEYQQGQGRADHIWDKRVPLLTQLKEAFQKEKIDTIVYVNGYRGNQYLADLESAFWVARYPENHIIPESFYEDTMRLEEKKNLLNQLLDENGMLKQKVEVNKTWKSSLQEEFLEKVIGWQFSESGAAQDGIPERIDLSIVRNSFFRQQEGEK